MIYGGHVLELVQSGLRIEGQFVSGHWRGGPSRWDWVAVRRLLVGTEAPPRVVVSGVHVGSLCDATGAQEE